jgi:cobalt-zinc-cadmium efflux system outer membrane protein
VQAPEGSAGPLQPALDPAVAAYELEELERLALEKNPTVAQARAEVLAAEGHRRQAGVYPNPTVGVSGDENTSNATFRGGEIGLFVEQRIVTAGKRGLDRDIAGRERAEAEAIESAQQLRVVNSLRQAFYHALAAQWKLNIEERRAALTSEAAAVTSELANVGQADGPDVLQAEIEAQRAAVALQKARNNLDRAWTQLSSLIGDYRLERRQLRGSLETLPSLEAESALRRILEESPEVRHAQAGRERASFSLERAKVDKWPDIMLHGGFRHTPLPGRDGRPIGKEGFFDVGIEIPIFDRRKGAVQQARSKLERADLEVARVELSLRARLAEEYREYLDGRVTAETYRDQMLPRARQAHDAYLGSFRNMAAAYPQVLIARRSLLELESEYVDALVEVWESAVEIDGLLLSGGLEPPSEAGSMGGMESGPTSHLAPAFRRHRD